ncbi:MAG: YlbL family protein [Propionibacteriaceae bacterium]
MTTQTLTGLVAAVAFVASASLVIALPVPFVAWSPGQATDTLGSRDGRPLVDVAGISTYPTTGQLDLTTVLQTRFDSRLTLPQAIWSYVAPHRDVLPRASIYASDSTAAQAEAQETLLMQTSQSDAVVAALRAADQPVTTLPVVASVTVQGPAYQKLQPGDLITQVDGTSTPAVDDVGAAIRAKPIGSVITFRVLRAKKPVQVTVTSRASTTAPREAVVGIQVSTGYRYRPDISFDLGDQIGGPSAGLVFSLAIYDKITPGALLGDRHVAGTGTITPDGTVGPIGGIQEKIAGAQDAGATVFLVPAANCADLNGVQTDLDLVKVATLDGAIAALTALDVDDPAALPRC